MTNQPPWSRRGLPFLYFTSTWIKVCFLDLSYVDIIFSSKVCSTIELVSLVRLKPLSFREHFLLWTSTACTRVAPEDGGAWDIAQLSMGVKEMFEMFEKTWRDQTTVGRFHGTLISRIKWPPNNSYSVLFLFKYKLCPPVMESEPKALCIQAGLNPTKCNPFKISDATIFSAQKHSSYLNRLLQFF